MSDRCVLWMVKQSLCFSLSLFPSLCSCVSHSCVSDFCISLFFSYPLCSFPRFHCFALFNSPLTDFSLFFYFSLQVCVCVCLLEFTWLACWELVLFNLLTLEYSCVFFQFLNFLLYWNVHFCQYYNMIQFVKKCKNNLSLSHRKRPTSVLNAKWRLRRRGRSRFTSRITWSVSDAQLFLSLSVLD